MCYCNPLVLTGTRMLCKPHGSRNNSLAVKTIYWAEQLGRAFSDGCINLTKFGAYKRALDILKASAQLLRSVPRLAFFLLQMDRRHLQLRGAYAVRRFPCRAPQPRRQQRHHVEAHLVVDDA
jgi:hypothetical protein